MVSLLAAGFSENFATGIDRVWMFFATGGWFMIPIVMCWFVSMGVIVFKCLDIRRNLVIPPSLAGELAGIDRILESGRFGTLQQALQSGGSPLARITFSALNGRHADRESAVRAAESSAREEIARLERGIPLLEIIFTISPMLGLIGTASGLVRIFSSFGGNSPDATHAREIALGIAEAMNCTIAGLAVAVPALIAQVLFSRQVEFLAHRMASLVNGAIDACWHYFHPGQESGRPVQVPLRR